MTAKAQKGKWPGGSRPYGYYIDRDSQKLIPHPDEAPILREIFTLYTHRRKGTRAIAAELNRRGIRNRTGKPWSGYTIARILDNPAYTGDLVYRDVLVKDAHTPLIDRDTWTRARALAATRADAHTQRAASDSDYHLTGLITCPDCGNKYVGTSATGRTRRYRYYTCFSRTRYGTAGCTAARLPADEIDTAVLQALHDFYTHADTLLTDAITRAQHHHHTTHTDRHAEHQALTNHIKAKEAAIERYHTAFENGTMDDTTCGPRLRQLRAELAQLAARRDEISDTIDTPPAAPAPETLNHIRTYLADTITHGTTAERKAAIEALIHEIKITTEGVIPVFKIPQPDPDSGHNAAIAAPVRTMVRSVGRVGLEPTAKGL